jgi:flagellar hook assembly protein FlgD
VAVDPQTPNRKLAIEAFPNPANPKVSFTLEYAGGGPVWLDIYDVRGRQVRTLIAGRQLGEGSPVVWDGRSDSGESAASGVYFARARYGEEVATVKFALVK